MINQICKSLTNKIRQEMPDIDDEEAEVIKYGLELIIGEVLLSIRSKKSLIEFLEVIFKKTKNE